MRAPIWAVAAAGLAALAALAAPAAAERPRPMKIDVAPLAVPPVAEASSRLIYMHRCPPSGCIVTQGPDDSRIDRSMIAQGTRTIGEFKQGDAVWNALMTCMRATYAPFNIGVTDQPPGSVPHYEHIVGGRPTQLRDDINGAGGVAPFTCAEIPNAISYTFDVYGPDAEQLCWTAAQETAHAFGLEHEVNQLDPLTYLGGPPKRFQAADSMCGEFAPRACECGNATQNTYMHLLGLFGPGVPTAPMVRIKAPASGKRVQPHFVTKIDASDDVAVGRVELYIDGAKAGEAKAAPYWIAAPDLAEGPHTVEARAFDVQGTPASTTIDVDLGPPCTASKGCEGDDVCVMGGCVPGPDAPGGLGGYCAKDIECQSLTCVEASNGKACVEACDLSPGSCPHGFFCLEDGAGSGVCWQAEGSGCCDAGGRPAGPVLLGAGVLALVLRRRRRA
jgi:hypothetical protein